MRHWIGLVLAGALVLALAACAAPAPPGPGASDPQPSISATATDPGSAPGLTFDPALPGVAALTCGGEERFPPAALQGPGTAELEADPAAAALRAVIAEGVDYLPASGWHRALATPTRVVFIAPGTAEVPWSMVALQQGPGGWAVDLYGDCNLAPILADGALPADFWLDPSAAPPDPAGQEIPGLIRERSCASGKPPEGRVLEPIVVVTEQAVVVTVPIRPAPGGQDCPGSPEVPIVIHLDTPLGDRGILDGSVFPPRDARVPPD